MAGAGFKTFVDGDILTAAQVNTYLMEQSVMVFASAAARTTAIAAPSEGMVTYRTDNNVIEYYDGAAWQPILDQDVIAAKGDLIVGTGDDTVSRLAVGTNNHVLTADSSTATGLKWAAAAGGGKILQVVSATYSTSTTITSATFTDSGLSASITPSSAGSQILVLVSQPTYITSGSQQMAGAVQLLRGSTSIYETAGTNFNGSAFIQANSSTTGVSIAFVHAIAYVDSPSTTSSVTYKTQGRVDSASSGRQIIFQLSSADSSIVLMEIGA